MSEAAVPPDEDASRCLNCEAELRGEYCHDCGQRARDIRRPVWGLIRDFVHETFDVDGRFTRSLRPFFLRPGQLTREYIAGRRVRYTSPLRLFLFASLLFFVVASPSCPIQPDPETPPIPSASELESAESRPFFVFSGDQLNTDVETQRVEIDDGGSITVQRTADVIRVWLVDDGRQEYYAIARDVDSGQWSEEMVHRLEAFGERLSSGDPKAQNELAQGMLDNAAKAVFLLVPLYALIVGLVVRRPRRTYVEHLVMSLHIHAFVFVALTGAAISEAFMGASNFVSELLNLAIVVYVVIAFRRAYDSSIPRALLRSTVAFVLYAIIVAPLAVALLFVSMAMLGG